MKKKLLHYQSMVIISFVSIALATVSVTSLNYYIQKSDDLLVTNSIYQQNELETIKDKAESLFGTSVSLMHQFWINSLDCAIPYFIEGVKTPQNLNSIINNLKTTQINFSQYGFALSILDPSENIVYSPSGTSSMEITLENLNFDKNLASSILGIGPESEPQCFINDKNMLLFCKPWSNASEKNRLIECYLYDLGNLKLDAERMEGCGFYLHYDGKELFSLQGLGLPPLLETVQASNEFIVSHRDSQFFGFSYTTASRQNPEGFPHVGMSRRILILLFIALLLLFLIFFFSRLLYRPINLLYHDALTLSSNAKNPQKNELAVVANTLTYLQDTIENLQETARSNKTLLREKKIRDLLLGLSNTEDIPQIVAELNLPIANNRGCIILIELIDPNVLGVYDLARISENVWALLKNNLPLFSNIGNEAVLQTFSLRRFCILTAQDDLDQLRTTAQAIKHALQDSFQLDLIMAIREIREHETIPEVYDRALILLNSNSNQRYNLLMEGKHSNENKNIGLVYELDTEKELIKLVQGGDIDSLHALVSHIISQNMKANVPMEQLCKAFQITLLRVVQNTGVSIEFVQFLDSITTHEAMEFQEILIKGLTLLSLDIQRKDKTETANFSQEVIRYIEENYNKNISLTDVADYFQFSTVYMSTLFKTTAGINFKEYLTNVRVKHAKELMEQGEKIYNVSYQVGCNNVDTFIRMFKRVTGISPGRYQMGYRKEDTQEQDSERLQG
jgi:AraC-like DNA-binding protein